MKLAALVAVALALGYMLGSVEKSKPALVVAQPAERVPVRLALSPLDCDARMVVSVAGIVLKEGCYNRETWARTREMP